MFHFDSQLLIFNRLCFSMVQAVSAKRSNGWTWIPDSANAKQKQIPKMSKFLSISFFTESRVCVTENRRTLHRAICIRRTKIETQTIFIIASRQKSDSTFMTASVGHALSHNNVTFYWSGPSWNIKWRGASVDALRLELVWIPNHLSIGMPLIDEFDRNRSDHFRYSNSAQTDFFFRRFENKPMLNHTMGQRQPPHEDSVDKSPAKASSRAISAAICMSLCCPSDRRSLARLSFPRNTYFPIFNPLCAKKIYTGKSITELGNKNCRLTFINQWPSFISFYIIMTINLFELSASWRALTHLCRRCQPSLLLHKKCASL